MKLIVKYPVRCNMCKVVIPTGDQYYFVNKSNFHVTCYANALKGPKHTIIITPPKKDKLGYPSFRKSDYVLPIVHASQPLRVPDGYSYLPYQESGIRCLLTRHSALLGDEMGLGKTIQAIGLINQLPDLRKILIITPTSLRYNWLQEISRWLVKEPLRVTSLYPEVEIERYDICVAPYSALENIPSSYTPEMCIVDEAHYVKNPNAKRTRALRKIIHKASLRFFLTGTPIENRVAELWTILQMLDPETWDPAGFVKGQLVGAGEGAGWVNFAKKHCGGRLATYMKYKSKKTGNIVEKKHFVFDGNTKLDELNKKLKATVLIRRLKKDVLPELPEKRRQLILLPKLEGPEANAEHQALVATGLDYESDLDDLNKMSIEFTEWAAARKAVGLKKVPYVIEFIQQCFDNGIDALVVFCHHKEVVWRLSDEFIMEAPAVYTGDCTEEIRHRAVTRFQDGETRLFIGTTGAAGVGLTLTRASHGIFAELEPKLQDQAEDRLHRIGQKNAVNWYYLVNDWSVDANLIKLIWKKRAIIEKALNTEP